MDYCLFELFPLLGTSCEKHNSIANMRIMKAEANSRMLLLWKTVDQEQECHHYDW